MTLNFVIAPDFPPERFGGWHMLNTLLQKSTGLGIRLLTPASHDEQRALIEQGSVDIMFANPFDSAPLVRKKGYRAFARPISKSNEMVIVTGEKSTYKEVEDLKPGCRIAVTDNKDVKLIGLRLLEPADLTESDVQWLPVDSYQAAARAAIKGEVEASFFLADAYHSLSKLTHSQLRVLVESHIADISHVFLGSPGAAEQVPAIRDALLAMTGAGSGQSTLDELGFNAGFEAIDEESMEFMIDLMETLLD